MLPGVSACFSPPTRDSHPGGVASMTRDKGYPDWLVLSARLLVQPSCGQVKNSAKYMFDHVPLWLCEDITACCYTYCYFRNKRGTKVLAFSTEDRHSCVQQQWRVGLND